MTAGAWDRGWGYVRSKREAGKKKCGGEDGRCFLRSLSPLKRCQHGQDVALGNDLPDMSEVAANPPPPSPSDGFSMSQRVDTNVLTTHARVMVHTEKCFFFFFFLMALKIKLKTFIAPPPTPFFCLHGATANSTLCYGSSCYCIMTREAST